MPPLAPPIPIEWNPFRPDIPSSLANVDSGLYDYLREQAELLREQHNSTQAGDSTFPWQMFATPGDRRVHTLGSVTRFVHETHGLFLARYVQFSTGWTPRPNPAVGHDKLRGDWVATNQLARTDLFRVIGFAGPFEESLGGKYGWVLTQGRGTFPIQIISETAPTQFTRLTWSPANAGVGIVGAGPQVGILLGTTFVEVLQEDLTPYLPPRWLAEAGDWYADVQGTIPEFTADAALLELASLRSRVTSLEGGVPPDYGAAVASLMASIASLTARANALVATGVAGEALSGHRVVRFDSSGIVWYADKDSAGTAPHAVGITTGAVSLGALATVTLCGKVVEGFWTWVAGPVWLGDDGQMTQTPPISGALVQVGVAINSTTLQVAPRLISLL